MINRLYQNPRVSAYFLILLLAFFALIYNAFLPLHGDEAYYWMWSHDLKTAYYDHPPMVAYFICLTNFISLLVIAPILYWGYQHKSISFFFQIDHGSTSDFYIQPWLIFEFFGAQFGTHLTTAAYFKYYLPNHPKTDVGILSRFSYYGMVRDDDYYHQDGLILSRNVELIDTYEVFKNRTFYTYRVSDPINKSSK